VSTRPDAIKVMVIDDAVVVRGLVGRWVGEETDMICVAAHRSARDAIADMDRRDPDVVILDIEMPDLDGITALPMLLEKKRDLVVIMASTLTRRNAEISLKCLSLGAADYVPKPESNAGVTTSPAFRRELVDKIRALGRRRRPGMRLSAGSSQPAPAPSVRMSSPSIVPAAGALSLRSFGLTMPKVLVIGASTGGPQALTTVLKGLGPIFDRAPVLITQHMPPTFTTILAEHAAKSTGRAAAEAKDGEPVVAGRIYVAPGGKHMRVKREGSAPIIQLDDGPAINFCKPAVDPLFASAAQVWGAATLALVLTGMGHDGADGAGTVVASGGSVIVQDEASSVVWGMPGATAQAGHASAVLPVDNIAAKIVRVFQGDRS
jgi:two-component system chemotaxis response regulator CheB